MLSRERSGNGSRPKPQPHGPQYWRAVISLLAVGALLMPALFALPQSSGAETVSQEDKWPMQSDGLNRLALQAKDSKTSPHAEMEMKSGNKSGFSVARPAQASGNVEYYVLNVEFRDAASRRTVFTDTRASMLPGASVLTTIDRFVDVFITGDAPYTALRNRRDVMRVEVVASVQVPPPPVSELLGVESRAVPDKIVRGGFNGRTGKGVIVAIIDSGIDFRHPDFITYDRAGRPVSRLLYLWDTATLFTRGRGSAGPFTYPNKTPIGTLYTRAQLTEALRKEAAGTASNIPATDENGHGTACASVAAGNGNGDKGTKGMKRPDVVGVAPEADLIGVRLGKFGLENSYLVNAASEWLDRVAGPSPLVVSGSFGGHSGGHDGQLVSERQLSSRFPLTKAGRALVIAAGNEGRSSMHAEATFGDRKSAKLVGWESVPKATLNIYFDNADPGLVIVPAKDTKYELRWDINLLTGHASAWLTLAGGIGGLWLYNESGKQTTAHLFLPSRTERGPAAAFWPEMTSYSALVGEPGTAANALTIGSYDWNDNFHAGGNWTTLFEVCRGADGKRAPLEIGRISCYSSPGPTRLGAVKPEIVAPGEWYSSSYAKIPGQGGIEGWPYVDSTGNYCGMNGTSAATPYTAGIIALIFQQRPTLTWGEVRNLMTSKASRDPFTGTVPNKHWGYGKLDMPAVERIFAALN